MGAGGGAGIKQFKFPTEKRIFKLGTIDTLQKIMKINTLHISTLYFKSKCRKTCFIKTDTKKYI